MRTLGRRPAGVRLERIRASPRWAGERFRNVHPIMPGLRDPTAPMPTLTQFLRSEEGRVPPAPLPSVSPLEAWARRPESGLRVTWLGHSTVLIEIGGRRLLTDPVWGLRASPSRLAGPRRFQPVPVPLRALPELDAVLISHDHYDHLDYPTIRQLRRQPVPFITSLGVGAHLEAWGVAPERIVELDWWESHTLAGTDVTVTAAPSQHFSGRTPKSRNTTLWSSLVIRSPRHTVFFSGDTGLTSEYAAIRERFGQFDLIMLEIGAFHPAWGDMHLGPDNALEAAKLLEAGVLLPIHWGTFPLAMHRWDQPAERLLELAPTSAARLLMPRLGAAVEPQHGMALEPWWRRAQGARSDETHLRSVTLPRSMPWPLD